jgi:hypothetical protein
MTERHKAMLYSGGHKGAEAEFGRQAQRFGLREVTFSFKGHQMEWSQDVRVLNAAELEKGDVSMEIVSRRLGRRYSSADKIRRVVQSLFHIVNHSYQVFAIGWIQDDKTVRGGTGWGVELAKFFNRPLHVFDQDRNAWFTWNGADWIESQPVIEERPFAGTGTRRLSDHGRAAIEALFVRSFGAAPEQPAPKTTTTTKAESARASDAKATPARRRTSPGRNGHGPGHGPKTGDRPAAKPKPKGK